MEPTWESLVVLARANLERIRFPDVDKEMVRRNLEAIRSSSKYPEVIAHNVMLARELCVASCLFYELGTVSLHYSAVACEVALRDQFLSRLPPPYILRFKKPDGTGHEEKTYQARLPLLEEVQMFSTGWKLKSAQTSVDPSKFGSLIRWGAKEGIILPAEVRWFENRQRTRNMTAHGHIMVGMASWPLGTLKDLTVMLNRLYPDAEATAYGEGIAREREARRRELDAEYNEMIEGLPESAEPDDGDP